MASLRGIVFITLIDERRSSLKVDSLQPWTGLEDASEG